MITSFADAMTEEIFHGIHSHAVHKKFSGSLQKDIQRKMDLLNSAESLDNLRKVPSHRPDAPVKDVHDKYSIPINEGIRLAFKWNQKDATEVEIEF